MDQVLKILDVVGYISTGIVVISVFLGGVAFFKGILPALFRLGNGLAKKKIAIYASNDHLMSMLELLADAKLFRQKNIIKIPGKEDLGKGEKANIHLVFWHDFKNSLDGILNQKNDGDALIIYAPRDLGSIAPENFNKLDQRRNTTVTNFRGRLLSDILVSMMTIGYERK